MGFMDKVKGLFGQATETAGEVAHKAKDVAGDVAHKAKDVAEDVKERFDGDADGAAAEEAGGDNAADEAGDDKA